MLIRSASPHDAEAIAALYRICFSSIVRTHDEWISDVQPTPRRSWDDILIAELDGNIVGALTLYPQQLYIGGNRLTCGGIGGVAVLPEYRRRGFSLLLLREAFRRMKETHTVLSMLYPVRHSFYAKAGYGLIGEVHVLTVAPSAFPAFDDAEAVRKYQNEDLPALAACYEQYAACNTCVICRTAETWQHELEEWTMQTKAVYCFHEADRITGYYVLSIQDTAIVSELVYLTPSALGGLLASLRNLGERVPTVMLQQTRDDYFQCLLRDPVIPEAPRIAGLFPESGRIGYGYMGRIIDCTAALRQRGYRPVRGNVTFEIDDSLFPENCRPVTLIGIQNQFTVESLRTPNTIQLSSSVFAQIFCGYLSVQTALKAGLATATGDISFADAAFAVPVPHCIDFF